MTNDTNDWVYCVDRLPRNNQTVWWAVRAKTNSERIDVYAGTIKNLSPYRGYDHFSYQPDDYQEYIAWKDRPMIAPEAPEYKEGILPERDYNKGQYNLTVTKKP